MQRSITLVVINDNKHTGRKIHLGNEKMSTAITSWQTFEITFDDIKYTQGPIAISPAFKCLGYEWTVEIWTCDDTMLNSLCGVGIVRFYLRRKDISSTATPKIIWSIAPIKDSSEHGYCSSMGHYNYSGKFITNEQRQCRQIFRPPMNSDGSLTVEVRMRLADDEGRGDTNAAEKLIIPENPLAKNILSKFMDEESADIVFEVVEGERTTTNCIQQYCKRSKTTIRIHAHRFILQQFSSTLDELCEPRGDGMTTISITDVDPNVFKRMLFYMYGGKLSNDDMKQHAKSIIDVVDKYGIVGLKLEAEAAYVTSETITIDNVIDKLLYADSKNLALLKEAEMDYLVRNGKEAMTKLSFDNVPGYAMKDLLAAMTRGKSEEGDATAKSYIANDYNTMRVNTLRKLLHERGLDVDGSREMMIARLEEKAT